MTWIAVVVSVLAFAFTALSFWWLHARQGSLEATAPRSYAFLQRPRRLRLPLVFFNTGAKALIVRDLRLLIQDAPPEPLRWISTRATLRPGPDDGFAFSTPFSVQGRETKEVIAEFGDELEWRPVPRSRHLVLLQAMLHHGPGLRFHPSEEWTDIAAFSWWAPLPTEADEYIAHRNEPADLGSST
jgi:hypothetical protein